MKGRNQGDKSNSDTVSILEHSTTRYEVLVYTWSVETSGLVELAQNIFSIFATTLLNVHWHAVLWCEQNRSCIAMVTCEA